jgi:hypothetical protein
MSWRRMGLSRKEGCLRFRDFTLFNNAFLAKQCCWLWSQPESLVARIMKAKYFAGVSILDAWVGH